MQDSIINACLAAWSQKQSSAIQIFKLDNQVIPLNS